MSMTTKNDKVILQPSLHPNFEENNVSNFTLEQSSQNSDIYENNGHGNTDEQYNAVIAFKQVLRRRKVYFDIFNNSSS